MPTIQIENPNGGPPAHVHFDEMPTDADIDEVAGQLWPKAQATQPHPPLPIVAPTVNSPTALQRNLVLNSVRQMQPTSPQNAKDLGKFSSELGQLFSGADMAENAVGQFEAAHPSTSPIGKRVPVIDKGRVLVQHSGSKVPDESWGIPGSDIFNDASDRQGVIDRTYDKALDKTIVTFGDGSSEWYNGGKHSGARMGGWTLDGKRLPQGYQFPGFDAKKWNSAKTPETYIGPLGDLQALDRNDPASVRAAQESRIKGLKAKMAQDRPLRPVDELWQGLQDRGAENIQAVKDDATGIGQLLKMLGAAQGEAATNYGSVLAPDQATRQANADVAAAISQEETPIREAAVKGFIESPTGRAIGSAILTLSGDRQKAGQIAADIPADVWKNMGHDPVGSWLQFQGFLGGLGGTLGKLGGKLSNGGKFGAVVDAAAETGRITPEAATRIKSAIAKSVQAGEKLTAAGHEANYYAMGGPVTEAAIKQGQTLAGYVRQRMPGVKLPGKKAVQRTVQEVTANASNVPSTSNTPDQKQSPSQQPPAVPEVNPVNDATPAGKAKIEESPIPPVQSPPPMVDKEPPGAAPQPIVNEGAPANAGAPSALQANREKVVVSGGTVDRYRADLEAQGFEATGKDDQGRVTFGRDRPWEWQPGRMAGKYTPAPENLTPNEAERMQTQRTVAVSDSRPGRVIASTGNTGELRKEIQQYSLSEELPEGIDTVYHETNVTGAKAVVAALSGKGAANVFVSDNPDLALGQGGKGVIIELDPGRVNGRVHNKPGTDFTREAGNGGEYIVDRGISGAVKAIHVKTKAQAAALAKSPILAKALDFDNLEKVDGGFRIKARPRAATVARPAGASVPRGTLGSAEQPLPEVPEAAPAKTKRVLHSGADVKQLRTEKTEVKDGGYQPEDVEALVDRHLNLIKYRDLQGKENVYLPMPSTSGQNTIPLAIARRLAARYGGTVIEDWATPLSLKEAKNKRFLEKVSDPQNFDIHADLSHLRGKNIVMVDDVFNTGDSIAGARRALAEKGIVPAETAALGASEAGMTSARDIERLSQKIANALRLDYNEVHANVSAVLAGTGKQFANYAERDIRGTAAQIQKKAQEVYDAIRTSVEARTGAPVRKDAGGTAQVQRRGGAETQLRSGDAQSVPPVAERSPGGEVPHAPTAQVDADEPPAKAGGSSDSMATTGGALAAYPSPSTPRVKVDPIPGGDPKRLSDIVLDLSKAIGKRINVGKTGRGIAGLYFPGTDKILIRWTGDLDTTAHEVAHHLDNLFQLVRAWAKPRARSPFDGELRQFWEAGGSATPNSSLAYRRAEGVAEWVRAYLINPDEAKRLAPNFYKHFMQSVPDDVRTSLEAFGRDIREWDGLPAAEKIGTNVAMDAPRPPMTTRLKTWLNGQGFHFEQTGLDKLRADFADRLHPMQAAVEAARELGGNKPLLPEHDPMLLARLHSGENDKIGEIFNSGMIDARGKSVTGGGIDWLLEPLQKLDGDVDKNMADAASLMIAQRQIERGEAIQKEADAAKTVPGLSADQIAGIQRKADLRKSHLTGIGGGIYSDDSVARAALKELQADPRYAKLQEAADRYRQWSDATLRYQLEKGRISQAQYDAIVDANQQYVDLSREMNTILPQRGRGGRLGTARQTIQRFKGSTREIKNPYHSLIQNTVDAVSEADRNEIMRAFRDLLVSNQGMHEGNLVDLSSIGHQVRAGTPEAIKIYVDGKAEHWIFEPGVHQALKGVGDDGALTGWAGALARLAGVSRTAITHNPGFAVRNLIRDTEERLIKTANGSNIKDLFTPTTDAQKRAFRLSGGGQAGRLARSRSEYERIYTATIREMGGDKRNVILRAGTKLGDGYSHLLHQSELANRYAEYKAAFRKAKNEMGLDDYNASLYAAGQARNLMDFAVAGNQMRKLNQVVPFTNAAIQGTRGLIRAAKANPARFWGRFGAYVVGTELLVYAWNANQGKKTLDEYRQLPPYQRDLFYNLKVGPDLWVRIPKGFELAVMSSGVGRAVDAAVGNKHAFDGYAGDVVHSIIPLDEQSLAGPMHSILEASMNYDTFRQKNIVPPHENELNLDRRKGTANASRLGQGLGALTRTDPRKADFLVHETLGGTGSLLQNISDLGRKDRNSGRSLAQGVSGLLTNSPATGAPDVQAVMSDAARAGLPNPLKAPLSAYYDAKTPAQRDAAAMTLREYAARLRPRYDQIADKPGPRRRR